MLNMSDLDQVSQIINQLSEMGVSMVKAVTPLAMGAARLGAIQNIGKDIFIAILFMAIGFVATLALITWDMCAEKIEKNAIKLFLVCAFTGAPIGFIAGFAGSGAIVDIYGYNHPDVYLAYQAYNKILDP